VFEGERGRVGALGGRDLVCLSGGREGGKEDGVDDGGESAVGLRLEDPNEVVACGRREGGKREGGKGMSTKEGVCTDTLQVEREENRREGGGERGRAQPKTYLDSRCYTRTFRLDQTSRSSTGSIETGPPPAFGSACHHPPRCTPKSHSWKSRSCPPPHTRASRPETRRE